MATLDDPQVRALLEPANYATLSTKNSDGSIHSTIVWCSLEGDTFAVNGAQGRHWCNNIDADPNVTVLVFADGNPYEYVEVRGTTSATRDDADDHIDRLAQLYINQDKYPYRTDDEVRVKFPFDVTRVRYLKQG